MQQRVKQFLSDLCFDITLFCVVLTPVLSMVWLVKDTILDLNIHNNVTVQKLFGVMVYGPTSIVHAWTSVPADFMTLCAWPTFVWAMTAIILRTYLWLGWSWRWTCWAMMLLKYCILGAMALLYVPAEHVNTAAFAMGIFPMIMTLMAALIIEAQSNKRIMTFELMAGVLLANQVVSPWLWLLFAG